MSGAEAEFTVFYRQERVLLVRWLLARGACWADAEDAAQRAFTVLWCRWPSVGNRHGYLYRVAAHELGRLRRADYRQEAAACRAAEPTGQATEDEVPVRLQAGAVLEHLLTLPPRQRMVLASHYDRDNELPGLAGLPAVTIRSNLRHARTRLRELAVDAEPSLRDRVLHQAYEEMRAGNVCPPGARPVISRSWARSARYPADFDHGPMLAPLSRDDLAIRRSTSPLRAAGPAVCALEAAATGLMMIVTDDDGRVLWRAGPRAALNRGERDGHGEGACLTERSVGTSGVSLALATGHAVLVHGAEHYAPGLHDLACAAAPVYHPCDGRLLGALNLTAPRRIADITLLWHIDQLARHLQRQLADPSKTRAS